MITVSGTTSACAENTAIRSCPCHAGQNYLRVRGEYNKVLLTINLLVELPPRARRILDASPLPGPGGGTTSACAENTPRPEGRSANPWNYLRVRGEYRRSYVTRLPFQELPPRARRIRRRWINTYNRLGTTSACAENTSMQCLSKS